MRNMVVNADKDRFDMLRRNADLEIQHEEPTDHSTSFQSNLRKIADLEREHIKLTANQSLAEVSVCVIFSFFCYYSHECINCGFGILEDVFVLFFWGW